MSNRNLELLKDYEEQLRDVIVKEKKDWIKLYIILEKINTDELWKEEKCRSFTAWVKNFCLKNKIHESIIWSKLKAGRCYSKYVKLKEEKGIEVQNIEEANIASEPLVLLDKIQRKSPEMFENIVDKVVNHELKSKDLRNAYKSLKSNIKKKNMQVEVDEDEDVNKKILVTANDIIYSLQNSSDWLSKDTKKKAFASVYEISKYKVMTEFPVFTGTTKKSRRIDVLIFENITTDLYQANVHGIEIKVSKGDLLRDQKFTEYMSFCNYFWLAIPNDLIDIAMECKPDDVGILAFDDETKSINVLEQAKKLDAYDINNTYLSLCLKFV